MEHFAHMQNRPQVLTYRARKKKKTNILISSSPSYDVLGSALMGKTIKARVRKIDQFALLGLTDPASLAWEKLPWSFVIDWIIPAGNYLEAINLNRALAADYVISSHFTSTAYGIKNKLANTNYVGGVHFNHTDVRTTRNIASHLDVRLPTVKSWDKIASWQHAANAVALLTQIFRR